MGAGFTDFGNGVQHQQISISAINGVGGTPASGELVGGIVDMLHANNFCNLFVVGGPTSGPVSVQVQTSDLTTSGSFVDPTSGLPVMPTSFQSGGILIVNSGLWASGSPLGPGVNNAPLFCSGGAQIAGFLRVGRYVRARALSGNAFDAPLTAGFLSQLKTTGSGAGFTFSPTSGTVSV
jgi:hypothetical protein